MHADTLPTSVGPFSLLADGHGVVATGFTDDPSHLEMPGNPLHEGEA